MFYYSAIWLLFLKNMPKILIRKSKVFKEKKQILISERRKGGNIFSIHRQSFWFEISHRPKWVKRDACHKKSLGRFDVFTYILNLPVECNSSFMMLQFCWHKPGPLSFSIYSGNVTAYTYNAECRGVCHEVMTYAHACLSEIYETLKLPWLLFFSPH